MYRSVFLHLPEAVAVSGLDGQFLECNLSFQKIVMSHGSMHTLFSLVEPRFLPNIYEAVARYLSPNPDMLRVQKGIFYYNSVLRSREGLPLMLVMKIVRATEAYKPLCFLCALVVGEMIIQ